MKFRVEHLKARIEAHTLTEPSTNTIITTDLPGNQISDLDRFNETLKHLGRFEICTCVYAVLSHIPSGWQLMSFLFLMFEYPYECDPDTIPPCDPECKKIVFPTIGRVTNVVTEWKLVCDDKAKSIAAQVIFCVGIMIGCIVFGHVADQHGRRPSFLASCFIMVITGILCGVTPWFWLYCISKFFLALSVGGWLISCLVFLVEYVDVQYREIMVVMIQLPFAVGYSILPAIAYMVPNWRHFQLIISGTGIFFVAYIWVFPESPRWLLLTGQIEKCANVVQSSSRNTNITRERLLTIIRRAHIELRDGDYPKMGGMYDLFRTKEMAKRTCILGVVWFCLLLEVYGLSKYVALISGNTYLLVGISAALMVVGTLLSYPILIYVNRRIVHAITFGLCAVCLFAIPSIDNHWGTFILSSISLALLSIARVNIQLICTEVFPTVLRNSGLGFSIFTGRIGPSIALMVLQTHTIKFWVPAVIYGVASVLSATIIIFLPETKGKKLSDTIQEGQQFLKRRNNPQSPRISENNV